MILFVDRNHPTYVAMKKLSEEIKEMSGATGEQRVTYCECYLETYKEEHGMLPADAIIDRLANFILAPYMGKYNEDQEYTILSNYSLERRTAKEVHLFDQGYYEQRN